MNGNTFGKIFRITTWGESHGAALGAVIDGCPSGLPLNSEDFSADLSRRQGGQSSFTTARKEEDIVLIESGVFEGKTTGTPISLRILNSQQNSADYEDFRHRPRPGHSDLTTHLKHGHRDHRGGGRSSARETTARVAAAVIAKKILQTLGVEICAWVERVGPLTLESAEREEIENLNLANLKARRDASAILVPAASGAAMEKALAQLKAAQDSWGGSIRARVEGLPPGVGEPVFDKLNALLAHALFSLPALVSCEIGGGEALSHLPGSAIRDPIIPTPAGPRPAGNTHGGLLGGMSTGLPLRVGLSFHAPTSVPRPISTIDLRDNSEAEIVVGGRHDAFPLPRAVPMVEAMIALTLVDALLRAGRISESL
jgi:chorismate synthase